MAPPAAARRENLPAPAGSKLKLLVVAVGNRMPAWVDAGFEEFARRMPRELPLQLVEVKAEARTTGKTVEAMMAAEASRIEAALPARCRRVILDERGGDLSTRDLARRLEGWQSGGEDVAFIVGGPDGLSPELKRTAAETLRLSSLTLPHALVRPLLAEALYRAWTVLRNHPYHRE
ncbi:23S rRNA (pseudouridine1915-N3)-methyltransferase [Azoarcus indigens]|uniref:Ribosomal RNA large subunit methyltransferase H n=1 Tax=Azoarcus indigens TaxID=29545 RepID=A0A4R6DU39_9RHOO|nr:23S rRNA (pseudouridine1915-N3)-methyltransferase [Azoarcus indigens]